jgi:hypothetical protein
MITNSKESSFSIDPPLRRNRLRGLPRLAAVFLALAGTALPGAAQDEKTVWKEFTAAVFGRRMTPDRIRPAPGATRETLLGYLNTIAEKASRREMEAEPEIHRVGAMVHFVVPMTFEGPRIEYCFSFVLEEGTWYFYVLELIFFRLDKIPPLPASRFPDLPEADKAFHREETRTAQLVYHFNYFLKEKDREFALNWAKDGNGYFASSKIRVPFLPPARAFILFLCWEQANLMGNSVTLEKLTDTEAVVRLETIYFRLYQAATHLKDQIAFEDYKAIFEAVWRDRAEKAGWKLEIAYEGAFPGAVCVFRFSRP